MGSKTKFYLFWQNNSGGRYLPIEGEMVHLVVEANSPEEANEIASKYIVLDVAECDCCGDNFDSFTSYNEEWTRKYITDTADRYLNSKSHKIIFKD
jgi:hypothetical protein